MRTLTEFLSTKITNLDYVDKFPNISNMEPANAISSILTYLNDNKFIELDYQYGSSPMHAQFYKQIDKAHKEKSFKAYMHYEVNDNNWELVFCLTNYIDEDHPIYQISAYNDISFSKLWVDRSFRHIDYDDFEKFKKDVDTQSKLT